MKVAANAWPGAARLSTFIVFAARFMAQRNVLPTAAAASAPGPGLGSRVMSGLATGAAVGAGVVAGEALMHHFMDGKEAHAQPLLPKHPATPLQDSSIDDMGGSDFGVSETSSWDDSAGGDWN